MCGLREKSYFVVYFYYVQQSIITVLLNATASSIYTMQCNRRRSDVVLVMACVTQDLVVYPPTSLMASAGR